MPSAWKKKYTVIEILPSGGQGDCYMVKENVRNEIFFLKQLKVNNKERRKRFFLETVLFKSLDVSGIPKIVDSNVEKYSTEEELFYCSEFIYGKRLNDLVEELNFNKLTDLFMQLLKILTTIHNQDIVHRDVKPENIIIDKEGKLHLVDFGISTYIESTDNLTTAGQELGNRFIRLPEYAAGSMSKRDVRSDLTLACGVALFMITNQYPRILVNEFGQYPHQTEKAMKCIAKLKMPFIWNSIFDKGFQQDLSKRWSNANEIIEIIKGMNIEEVPVSFTNIEEQLMHHAKMLQEKYFGELKNNLITLNHLLKSEVNSIIKVKAPGFRTEEMGRVYNLGDLENKNQIRAYPIGRNEHVIIIVKTQLIGEQIVGQIDINGALVELCRLKSGDNIEPQELFDLKSKIEKLLLPSLLKLIS